VLRTALIVLTSLSTLLFAGSAMAASASVGLGTGHADRHRKSRCRQRSDPEGRRSESRSTKGRST
jgi:hypothetical protein